MKDLFTIKFAGRMRRAEYWPRSIFLSLLSAVLLFLELALSKNSTQFVIMYVLMQLTLGLVMMGMTARRLHDAGFSGWMQLWGIVPSIVGTFIAHKPAVSPVVLVLVSMLCILGEGFLFVVLCLDSKPGKNEYGPDPKGDVCGRTDTSVTSLIKGLFIVKFAGRMRRQNYWLSFCLFQILFCLLQTVSAGMLVIHGPIAAPAGGIRIDEGGLVIIATILGILLLALVIYCGLVWLGMQVRRLHDIGVSGWTVLLCLIPILGGIILIVMSCRDSQRGVNQWGPNPKEYAEGRSDIGEPI